MDNLDYLPFYFMTTTIVILFLKRFKEDWFAPKFDMEYFHQCLTYKQDNNTSNPKPNNAKVLHYETQAQKNSYKLTLFYFFIITFVSCSVVANHLSVNCDLPADKTALNTFIKGFLPCLIIAIMYWFLIIFPGLKNIFANVFGYLIISISSNNRIATILKNDYNITKYSSTLTKLLQNEFILINRLSPTNFYDILTEFIQEQNTEKTTLTKPNEKNIQNLYNAIYFKDNIGEFFWILYTCIFVSTLICFYVSLNNVITQPSTTSST